MPGASYNGNEAGLAVTDANVTITEPIDGDADNAATFTIFARKLADWAKLLKDYAKHVILGTKSLKSLLVDGTGDATIVAAAGDIECSGGLTVGGVANVTGDVNSDGNISTISGGDVISDNDVIASADVVATTGSVTAATNVVATQDATSRHLIGTGAGPSYSAGSGWGAGGAGSIAGKDSSHLVGVIPDGAGTGPELIIITYGTSYGGNVPRPVLCPLLLASFDCGPYISATSNTGYTISCKTNPGAGTQLFFHVIVVAY